MQQMTYEYARRGAYLVIVARREELLKNVAEKALELGSPDVRPICADVVNVEDCKRSVDEAVRHFGRCKFYFHPLFFFIIILPLFLCSVLNLNLYLILNCFPPFLLQWIMLSIMLEFFLFSRLKT